jgi:hypothetical protein
MPEMSLLAWQKKYGTEKACSKALLNACLSHIPVKELKIV